MTGIKSATWTGLALLLAVAGCSDPAAKNPAPPAPLEGRWSGTEVENSRPISIVFTNSDFAYFDADGKEIGGGTFIMNRSVRPMEMDLTFERMPSPDLVGKVGQAIFELNGDELKIAAYEVGSDRRPTMITNSPGLRIFVLKRE
ncbi:MAG TPA: hypothetical protein VFV81_09025 [Verrucomicrobiae bacterium]|nr:hypothetical protein [Verrucomicrobiae bacterium]